jgi:hypothetical protein
LAGRVEKPLKTATSEVFKQLRLFQNPVGFETTSWKSGQMSAFPYKSKVAVPKTEVLEQPQLSFFIPGLRLEDTAKTLFSLAPAGYALRKPSFFAINFLLLCRVFFCYLREAPETQPGFPELPLI